MDFRSLFNFDKMVTPTIIKILYYIGLISAAIGGIVVFFGGIISAVGRGGCGAALGGLIGGPGVVILGVLVSRIYAELMILTFKIYEHLTAIRDLMANNR